MSTSFQMRVDDVALNCQALPRGGEAPNGKEKGSHCGRAWRIMLATSQVAVELKKRGSKSWMMT